MDLLRIFAICVLALGLSACRKKSDAAAKEVREAGYEMTAEGWFGAVRGNDVAVMRKMVDGGFDAKATDAEGNGALHVAAASGSLEAGEYLLNRGFSIDAKGAGGRTALMAAVLAERPEMVKWLLRQGADPRPKDDDGFMALMLAVNKGGKASVEELAPYHREDLDSALLLAALVGEAGVIDSLTNYGASVYARMEDGRTPLMLAAQNGHREAAEMLIDIGASRFATIESGDTAQSLAVAAGHADLAEMIEKGFSGDTLALESDEELAENFLTEFDGGLEGPSEGPSGDGALASNDGGNSAEARDFEPGDDGSAGGDVAANRPPAEIPNPVASLEGARVSNPVSMAEIEATDRVSAIAAKNGEDEMVVRKRLAGAVGGASPAPDAAEVLPLVMRQYRQRELPVEVKQVSGEVATLHLVGAEPRDVTVSAGQKIPGSDLVVVRVFTRTEHGKLNDGNPIEVGIVEVEDSGNGRKMEWLAGRPASGHEPVALVEDAATGRRYLAKPGQKFTSEDGRVFVVSDVRPSQLVIEDEASGEVRTLRLRGPKG